MDRLFWPLIIFALSVSGRDLCFIDDCSNDYTASMAASNIGAPQASHEYCEILTTYQKCLKSRGGKCRGNMLYQATDGIIKQLVKINCGNKGGKVTPKNDDGGGDERTTTPFYPVPSCRFAGRNVFKHCGFFGDPHLKTFDSKYQTCRVHGEWYLIDNPFMSVALTNEFVAENDVATAPTKIVIVVKSRSTPCTLEKRYEADTREERLPSTFVDGTDRPGSDETVSLKFTRNDKDNTEKVEIYMKYIASNLVVRRIGKYLSFSARLPEEVIKSSSTYSDQETSNKIELCTAGCPADELLSNLWQRPRRFKVDRERALYECQNADKLSHLDLKRNLTGSYLDWCIFDLMSAGVSYDFVAAAHVAQADALSMDPSAAPNGTEERSLWPSGDGQPASAGGAQLTWRVNLAALIVCQTLLLTLSSYLTSSWPVVTTSLRLRQPRC